MRPQVTLLLLLILLFRFPLMLSAQQPLTISGDATFAANEEIRLLIFDDLLNNIPKVVATARIDQNGQFNLTCSIPQIQLAQLAIRATKAELFVVPNQTYHLHISTDTNLFKLLHPERYGGYLEITKDQVDTNDLNYKINRFSNYFGRAMNYYGFRITYDHDLSAYDTLLHLLHQRFDIQYNPFNFYQSYTYYTCGLLDRICKPKETTTFYHKYFDNDYILYNNPAYMMLFTEVYGNYLYNSRYISKEVLARTINDNPDYLALFNESGRDPMLANERLRELVLILNLINLYDNEEFDRGNIVKLIKYIKASTHFSEHLVYLDNALARFTPNKTTSEKLEFKNSKGEKSTLNQFDKKDIFVQFFQSDCIDCIREMMLLKEFNTRYGEKVQFVSICLDPDVAQYEKFCSNYEKMFDWPILHFNDNYDWLMAYGIETLPDHLILDHQGHLLDRYLPDPENGLADYFQNRYPLEEKEIINPLFRNRE